MVDKINEYYNEFLKIAIKSKEQLDMFLKQDEIRKKFNQSEIDKLKKLWKGTPLEKTVETVLDTTVELVEKQVEETIKAADVVFETFTKKRKY